MRRLLAQCAWAAVRTKGSYAQQLFNRLRPRLGTQKAIWAVAHYLVRVIWTLLHNGVEYEERGSLANAADKLKRRLQSTVRALRRHGLNVQIVLPEEEGI